MVSANGFHGNSNGTNGRLLDCPSDYEPIDITPLAAMPRPKWRDQFPAFTHNLSWVDSDGLSHSMTLRSDDLQGLMGDLKLLKGMRRQAKQKATEQAPQQAQQATEVEQPDVLRCKIHGVDMARRYSKRTNASYFSHRMPDDSLCYGREKKA